MERGTESRSKRPRRTNGSGDPTPSDPPDQPSFVETAELEFDFSSIERERPLSEPPDPPVLRPEPPESAPEPPALDEPASPNDRAEPDTQVDVPSGAESDFAGDGDGPGSDRAAPATVDGPRDARTSRIDREVPLPATSPGDGDGGDGNGKPPQPLAPPPFPPSLPKRRTKPRLKKLRMLFVLLGLSVLALASAVFGMIAAVATSDLPAIYNFPQFRAAKNSVVLDDTGAVVGTLSSNQNKILLDSGQISQNVKNATVAIEDSRFYQHGGVDFRGIARALVADLLSGSSQQGASTITEQFVKNALQAQGSRTILEKFREAALAYKLEQHWTKDKILTEYLNTIYFGEGAYGIEAAARTYFGYNHPGCGTRTEPCASVLLPQEAAMLAGLIASPSAYDPKVNPVDAKGRRDEVLSKMLEQGYITQQQYTEGVRSALPSHSEIKPPTLDSKAPYFTSWLRQQLVDRYGAGKAFFGGLKVHSTLDLGLQKVAEDAIYQHTAGVGITGSMVVIDNKTGAVKAMVGGPGYDQSQFNVATQGARQPGSSFKPFTLVSALELGRSPYEVFTSAPKVFHFGKHGREVFTVKNFQNNYLGSASLITATTYSDNSVYADLGVHLKKTALASTTYIAKTAHKMGITTPLSTNPAMVLGGLQQGVDPLEMTHAYETLAENGNRISGTLAPRPGIDPIAYNKVTTNGHAVEENRRIETRVMPASVADTAKSILTTVISQGTGTHAAGVASYEWGKTGTTENYGDAWFCGATTDTTTCVWVGHLDSTQSMSTEYGGSPVEGGTIPADIWQQVMSAWEQIRAQHAAASKNGGHSHTYVPPTTSSSGSSGTYSAPAPSTGTSSGGGGGGGGGGGSAGAAPKQAAPASPAPSGGGGGGASSGAGGVAPG